MKKAEKHQFGFSRRYLQIRNIIKHLKTAAIRPPDRHADRLWEKRFGAASGLNQSAPSADIYLFHAGFSLQPGL